MQSLPKFSEIKTEEIFSTLEKKLQSNRNLVQKVIQQPHYTWNNSIQILEDMDVELGNYWAEISHMHSVVNTPELRQAYEQCLPILTAYSTEMGLNEKLYQVYETIKQSPEFSEMDKVKQQVIEHTIRDFKLAGVALKPKQKEQFQKLQLRLAELTNEFEQNILDATDHWQKHIEDESLLVGIPENAKQSFKEKAQAKNVTGWLLGIDFPSYFAVITYAQNQDLRQEVYTAYTTRASDKAENAAKFDNSKIMFEILKLRHEKAQLLNYPQYANYSLATKMAKSPTQIMDFLQELIQKTKSKAQKEFKELQTFAKSHLDIDELQAWDIAYASEKLKEHSYDLSQEILRPYFEVNHVTEGLFTIASKLYQITIVEDSSNVDTWHPDVKFYNVYNQNKQLIAGFYLDLYARPQKRGGAWMDDCRVRHKNAQEKLQLPIAYLTCNFTPPLKGKPALLTHDDVLTLFHEFGHGLHHMLTQIDVASVSGINGVAWDAVEFPSQFMENWCWQKDSLQLFAYHYETKEPLPENLFNKLIASKNFQAGMQMLRQLEFALFDFRIYNEFSGENSIQTTLDEVRKVVAVVPIPGFNRFQNSFSHIFSGGYAAGYYSYKWAEVLAADAFSLFAKKSIFDEHLGQKFLHCILEKGGSREALDLFIDFQGREPDVNALLKDAGIDS